MELSVVQQIEEVSARAWPPLHSVDLDGWVLRAGGGVTGRANSVWARANHGALTVDEKLAAAADFYRGHELPLLLQVSPTSQPAGLADALAARGYEVLRARRSVQIAPLDTVAQVGKAVDAAISDQLDADWYAVVTEVNSTVAKHPDVTRRLLAGVSQPSAYAAVIMDGVTVAAGRGVYDDDWLGVFNMATVSAYRRRGAAAAVLAALAEWGLARGASRAYLQMEADNDAAPALYAKAGFTHCYEYSFWGRREAG